jgi:ElaA protein
MLESLYFCSMIIHWEEKAFNQLSPGELYSILDLRNRVFVDEQHCAYVDTDGKDIHARHLCGWSNETLIAYTRLLPPGISYENMSSIGRVVVRQEARRFKIGYQLMEKSISICLKYFPGKSIKISAQLYIESFYKHLGFQVVSPVYLEDNIEHVEMVFTPV